LAALCQLQHPSAQSFDTGALIDELWDQLHWETVFTATKTAVKADRTQYGPRVWSLVFNMDRREFKPPPGYYFCNLIKTDGVHVSITFKRISRDNRAAGSPQSQLKPGRLHVQYIDSAWMSKRLKRPGTVAVAVDPGIKDIFAATTFHDDPDTPITFRYTQAERRHNSHKDDHDRR